MISYELWDHCLFWLFLKISHSSKILFNPFSTGTKHEVFHCSGATNRLKMYLKIPGGRETHLFNTHGLRLWAKNGLLLHDHDYLCISKWKAWYVLFLIPKTVEAGFQNISGIYSTAPKSFHWMCLCFSFDFKAVTPTLSHWTVLFQANINLLCRIAQLIEGTLGTSLTSGSQI